MINNEINNCLDKMMRKYDTINLMVDMTIDSRAT